MAVSKLTDILKDGKGGDRVAARIEDYERRYGGAARGGLDERKADYRTFENTYYDLVTDFYEYGWGESFHFAPRAANESFAASLARHEHYLAHRLGLSPGMTAVDLGCGVGGSLIEIARFSGARIVGVNNNALQLERAARRSRAAGLSHLADWLECDFMQVDAADASFRLFHRSDPRSQGSAKNNFLDRRSVAVEHSGVHALVRLGGPQVTCIPSERGCNQPELLAPLRISVFVMVPE